jgi:hypothetical protein
MVKLYLRFFLKYELKRILSYFSVLLLIIFFIENNQSILESPFYLYLGLFVTIFCFVLIYMRIKAIKLFLILDNKMKQEEFKEERGIDSVEGRRVKAEYKYWLFKDSKNGAINSIYKRFFNYNTQNYCLYCFLSVVPIIIVWAFSMMYLTPTEASAVSIIFVGCLILFCITWEKRELGNLYKKLDSEVKQILFEEITGYEPMSNGKLTYKYKAWLILND